MDATATESLKDSPYHYLESRHISILVLPAWLADKVLPNYYGTVSVAVVTILIVTMLITSMLLTRRFVQIS